MVSSALRIVTLDTIDGLQALQRLQEDVWGKGPDIAMPLPFLIAAGRNGGIVLGAYISEKMVGLLFSVPALYDNQHVHLLHMVGVHPDWQGHGIGRQLAWRQREMVLAQGIEVVVWTYTPLLRANATLYLAHLGAVVCTYMRDYYGPGSDRFVVQWSLSASRVQDRASGRAITPPILDVPITLSAVENEGMYSFPGPFILPSQSPTLVEIPPDIDKMKRDAPLLAETWRERSGEAFEQLFAKGYVATNVVRQAGRYYYYFELERS